MGTDTCPICGKEIILTAPHSYDRALGGPVHIECAGIGRKKSGRDIILAYNQQDHYDMAGFKPLEVMIDEALAGARNEN